MTPLHQVGLAGLEEQVLCERPDCLRERVGCDADAVQCLGGDPPFTARLSYRILPSTATSEKFFRQVAVKFALDRARTRAARSNARTLTRDGISTDPRSRT